MKRRPRRLGTHKMLGKELLVNFQFYALGPLSVYTLHWGMVRLTVGEKCYVTIPFNNYCYFNKLNTYLLYYFIFWLHHTACRISVSQGSNLGPQQWRHGSLTAGLQGIFPGCTFKQYF